MLDIKKTITSIFIVPTLGIGRDKLRVNGFLNGYIRDDMHTVIYDNCVCLLFRPSDIENFKEFLEDEYGRTNSVIDDYDYDNGFVVVVYELDSKFKRDYGLIMEGMYSKTSPEFQKLFHKVIKIRRNGINRDEISLQFRVFNKTEDLRQYWQEKFDVEFDETMEVWAKFDIDKETLDIKKLDDYV